MQPAFDLFGTVTVAQQRITDVKRIAHAGELLAAFELIMLGADVSLASEGKTYDLLADINNKLWKVQVKSAACMRSTNKSNQRKRLQYCFSLKHGSYKNGHGRARQYIEGEVDCFAFVAVDIRKVIFIPFKQIKRQSALVLNSNQFDNDF